MSEWFKEQPPTVCECGGYIAWQDCGDRWEGSCYGTCASYPIFLPARSGSGGRLKP